MIRISEVDVIRERVSLAKRDGQTVGLVPTLGYLHEGHASLIEAARKRCELVIVSVFVNPLQFGPKEDFARYPRDLERDSTLASVAGADVLFCPDTLTMYPNPPRIRVTVSELSETLCGAARPGHFDGVVTVVAKLFNIVRPDFAFFGQKDAQQVIVIEQLVRDLNFPIEIVPCPTVREDNGLAKSSRNVYLSVEERRQATCLYRGLHAAKRLFDAGVHSSEPLIQAVQNVINEASLATIDYISIVSCEDVQPVTQIEERALLAIAVRFGSTRLIDNMILRATNASDKGRTPCFSQ